jgi:hypothetical protein
MFSCWIVTNITSARGTLHCRKTRIPCGDQFDVCGLYLSSERLHTRENFPIFCNFLIEEKENNLTLSSVGNRAVRGGYFIPFHTRKRQLDVEFLAIWDVIFMHITKSVKQTTLWQLSLVLLGMWVWLDAGLRLYHFVSWRSVHWEGGASSWCALKYRVASYTFDI